MVSFTYLGLVFPQIHRSLFPDLSTDQSALAAREETSPLLAAPEPGLPPAAIEEAGGAAESRQSRVPSLPQERKQMLQRRSHRPLTFSGERRVSI